MNDSSDAAQSTFSTLFYTLHWFVIGGVICVSLILRTKTPKLQKSNDGFRGDVERLIGQRKQLHVLENKWSNLRRLDTIDSYQSDTELSRRIRIFCSVNLTKYLPDDFTNSCSDDAEVKSDDEQNWIFVYAFKDNSRYLLGLFSSRKGNDNLRVEIHETNSEYLSEGADVIAVHEVENIRPGWNFLVCEITNREDDVRLTARLTDKTLQQSGSEQLDFGSLKTMLNLDPETSSPAVIKRIWAGHSYNDMFVYCQSHKDKNPKNEPLVSLKFKSPSKEQGKHLRIDFRLSQ